MNIGVMVKKIITISIVLIVSIFNGHIFAASFDCSKASTKIEVLICNTPDISELDVELAKLYSLRKKSDPGIFIQQKKWLVNVRGLCSDVVCLRNVYSSRVNEFRTSTECPVSDNIIVGRWFNQSNGFFEEMLFSFENGQREFGSWRHQRPEMFGKWSLENCILAISGSGGEFNFAIKEFKKNKLYLFGEDKELMVYRK